MKKSKFGTMEEPKAAQLQKATHQEILSVGQQVFQNEMDTKEQQFTDILRQREQEVLTVCEQEKQEALQMLREEQAINIKKVKEDAIKLQNLLLKSTAKRVRPIMKRVATSLDGEDILDGQIELEHALVDARIYLDSEKQEAVNRTIGEQCAITTNNKRLADIQRADEIQELHRSCQNRMKQECSSLRAAITHRTDFKLDQQRLRHMHSLVSHIRQMNETHQLAREEIGYRIRPIVNDVRNVELEGKRDFWHEKCQQADARMEDCVDTFQRFITTAYEVCEGKIRRANFSLLDDATEFLPFSRPRK